MFDFSRAGVCGETVKLAGEIKLGYFYGEGTVESQHKLGYQIFSKWFWIIIFGQIEDTPLDVIELDL